MRAYAACLSIMLFASPASATLFVEQGTFGGVWGTDAALAPQRPHMDLPAFDTSLGVLQAATVHISGDMRPIITGSQPLLYPIQPAVRIFINDHISVPLTFPALQPSGSLRELIDLDIDLAPILHELFVDTIYIAALSDTGLVGHSMVGYRDGSFGKITATVTFAYQQVPEPSSLFLLGVGVLAIRRVRVGNHRRSNEEGNQR